MEEVSIALIISSFIAGLITFLAPCTLPLVPAYLGFISGVSNKDLEDEDSKASAKKKIIKNGIFFILGFSFVFIIFGALFGSLVQVLQLIGIGPTTLEGEVLFREKAGQIGGLMVILFGAFMLGLFKLDFLNKEKRLKAPRFIEIGKPTSSLIIGGAFAFGWTPCVGPILGSILLLASTEGSVLSGIILLSFFSLGLGIPFILIALGFANATERINKFVSHLSKYRVAILGAVGLIFGFLLDLVVVAVFAKLGLALTEHILVIPNAFLIPVLSSVALALMAKKNKKIDVLSTVGGLFLVALGTLLALGSFGLLIQYGFIIFGGGLEDILFEYL
jgi:cytochrome c-type biogenesis protein